MIEWLLSHLWRKPLPKVTTDEDRASRTLQLQRLEGRLRFLELAAFVRGLDTRDENGPETETKPQ